VRRSLVWAAVAVAIAVVAWGLHALLPALSGGVAMGAATALLLVVVWVGQRLRE